MDASTAASAVASLKAEPTPKTLRVYLVNGKLQSIAIDTKRRWKTKVARILASMDWEAIEPLDLNENLIGPRIENKETGKATELEDLNELDPQDSKGVTSVLTLCHGFTKLMLKAQDVALDRQAKAYNSVLDNNQKLVSVISGRLLQAEQHAQESFATVTALHNRLNLEIHNQGGDDSDASDELADFAQSIIKEVMAGKLNGQVPAPAPAPPSEDPSE